MTPPKIDHWFYRSVEHECVPPSGASLTPSSKGTEALSAKAQVPGYAKNVSVTEKTRLTVSGDGSAGPGKLTLEVREMGIVFPEVDREADWFIAAFGPDGTPLPPLATVSEAGPADLEGILAIRRAVIVDERGFPGIFTEDDPREIAVQFVAKSEGEVVGAVRLVTKGLKAGRVDKLVAKRELRPTGIEDMLVEELIERARQSGLEYIWLIIPEENIVEQRFYTGLGFIPFGERIKIDEVGKGPNKKEIFATEMRITFKEPEV